MIRNQILCDGSLILSHLQRNLDRSSTASKRPSLTPQKRNVEIIDLYSHFLSSEMRNLSKVAKPKKSETQTQFTGKAWSNFKTTTAVLLLCMQGSIQYVEEHEVI
jgi:hypothetical protein